jgi:nucleotide-binding universal stress UspA family protein
VPVDLAEPSTRAISQGKELAACYDAELQILHVVESAARARSSMSDVESEEWTTNLRSSALSALRGMVEESAGPEVAWSAHVSEGRPRGGIVGFAESHCSDLVVMARHGRTGMAESLHGSLTEAVVRTAPCPVFTLRVA